MKKVISVILCMTLLLSSLLLPNAFAAEDIVPALYLSFDEAVNGVVYDSTGNYSASLMGGAKLAEGLYGQALCLDGVNAYAQLPAGTNLLMGNSYSISLWVKMVTNESATHILDFGNSDSHYCYLAANYPTDNGPRWTLKDNGSKKGATANVPVLPIGQWTHVAVTCDNGEVMLYVDGELLSIENFTENPAQLGSLANCWLGRSQFSVDPYLHASIDELKIYKQALPEKEVIALATKPYKPVKPDDHLEKDTNANIFFACSDVHEYNDGVRDVFGYVVNDLKLIPDYALFAGDYCYHIGGNASQTEVQRAEVDEVMKELSPNTRTFYYQGNHDNINAAGMNPSGLAGYNDYYVVYGINLGDLSSSVQKLRTFLEGYQGNPDFAGKPLFIVSHCPLDETRRTDHAGGTAPSYISLLNEFSDSIDIVFFFGHSHTEEYENTFVTRGGTIDPENGVIGDSATLNFTYLNAGFITNKDYAYSSGTSSAGQPHSSALKGPDYNTRVNAPGATAYELVRRNTVDAAYATEDTVFFWDVTSGCILDVGEKEIKIERYGYPADGTKENHPVVKLASYTVPRAVSSCEHEYEKTVTEATCLDGGYTTSTCTKCGYAYVTDRTEALGHDWDDGTVTVAPTETTPGVLTIACKRCDAVKTKRLPRVNATVPEDIDFTDPASADQFAIIGQKQSAIAAGTGLALIATRNAIETCNDQNSGDQAATPEDLVAIEVEGDWAATLKVAFDTNGASNGYYQFFGFYAAAGEGYDNMAGIRGGDGAMQNFLRVDGSITADSEDLNSKPGFATSGADYWLRIEKIGDSYTCFRSDDGENFTEMFAYADTGIDADKIVIDAYTGMTANYKFTLKSLTFEDVGGAPQPPLHEHSYAQAVTAPTCTEEGYTTYTCTCGESYVADKVAALGHDIQEATVSAKCTETGSVTKTCSRCDYKDVTEIPALGHSYVNGKCTRCGEKDADYVCNGGEACPSKVFTDAPKAGTWSHAGIDYCVETGLMKGISDNIFKPDGTVTRGQLVTILYRIAGEPEFTTDKKFSDVADGRYYTKAVLWAAENNIVNGYSDGTFLPNREISREQIAAILYRYEGSPEVSGKLDFPDAAKAGSYAEKALIWATQKGLITGVKTNGVTLLNPKASAPRAQIATIIMRYLES